MVLVTPRVIEYHEIPAEMISQQIPGYRLNSFRECRVLLKGGEWFIYISQMLCIYKKKRMKSEF